MSRKRKPKPTPQELEAQATEILQRDTEERWAEIIQKNTEAIERLEQIHYELRQPSNDPQYLASLQAVKTQRDSIANQVLRVHVVPDQTGTWVGLEMRDKANHGNVLEVARQVAEHLEAEVIRHDRPSDTP